MKFFHRKPSTRAKKNKIKRLKKDDGEFTLDKKIMEFKATKFFKDLYTAYPSVCPQEVLQLFHPLINDAMNTELCKDFLKEVISDALFQIGPLKALGPDEFPARFFRGIGKY
jgi:hypothetical protein